MRIASLTSLLLLTLMINVQAAPQAPSLKLTKGNYKIDSDHTRVSFVIPHFVISQVQGRFNEVSGTFYLSDKIEESKVEVMIPVNSIDTGVKKRDDHLKSDDFFNVRKFPNMRFKSTKFSGTLEDFKMTGDLTIKGVTRPVTFSGKYTGSVKDSWGQTRAAVLAEGEIKRKDFNIMYNDMVEAGPAVGDEVTMMISTEGILEQQPEKKK